MIVNILKFGCSMIGILYKIFILECSLVFNKSSKKTANHMRKSKFQNTSDALECIFLIKYFSKWIQYYGNVSFSLHLRIFVFEA